MVGCQESPTEELHMVTCFHNGLIMFDWHAKQEKGERERVDEQLG